MDLRDLVDKDLLVKLQQNFTESLGFNVAFTGLDSKTVGVTQRQTVEGSICALLQTYYEGETRCYESDKEAGEISRAKEKIILYRCHCYFSNFVIPVIVGDEVIGFLYGGQFFCPPIADVDRKEWDELKSEIGAIIWTTAGKLIKPQFFQVSSIKPTRQNLQPQSRLSNPARLEDRPTGLRYRQMPSSR